MRAWSLLVAGAVLVCASGGCSSDPHSIAIRTYRGLPPGQALAGEPALGLVPAAGAFAALHNGRLALTFWGSGSCPTVPTKLRVVDTKTIDVTVSRNYHHDCDADLGPTTSELSLDEDKVVLDASLRIRLTGAGFPPGQVIRLIGG